MLKDAFTLPRTTRPRRRPWVFTLLFWGTLAASYLTHLVNVRTAALYGGPERMPEALGVLPATAGAMTVVGCWLVLPWVSHAGLRWKVAAPVFVVCVSVFGYLTGMTWAQGLYLVAFANAIFLFGFRRGFAYSAALLPLAFFAILISWQPDVTPGRALYQTLILALAGAFVAGVCDAVVKAMRSRDEQVRLLDELQTTHAELRDYSSRVRELSIADERARLARELHDSVGHHLTVVNLQLQNAERFRQARPEEAWREVSGARKTTLAALEEVRRAVRALKPLGLEQQTLCGALAALVRSFEQTGIEAVFDVEGEERELVAEARLALYRATQEGLTNAAKHSGALGVTVALAFEEGGVRLTVADDGSGTTETDPAQGFGLDSLRQKIEELDGVFSVGDSLGGGFALEVELPSVVFQGIVSTHEG